MGDIGGNSPKCNSLTSIALLKDLLFMFNDSGNLKQIITILLMVLLSGAIEPIFVNLSIRVLDYLKPN